jgi:hypothetical protein
MVGAGPQILTDDRVGFAQGMSRGQAQRGLQPSESQRTARRSQVSLRSIHWIVISSMLLVPFAAWLLIIIQGTSLPEASAQATELPATGTSAYSKSVFDARYPTQYTFAERFAGDSYAPRQTRADRESTGSVDRGPIKVAALVQPKPVTRSALQQAQTKLVSLESSAFPYFGNNPRTDQPFLNVSNGERRGHRGLRGRVLWQDETFKDNRVLVHMPKGFDVRKPGVIVVFFHGHGATLERDVRDRQLVPQQISDSGVNAVLLAPQFAVDAADSSAGKFWQPGGFKRFMAESAQQLGRISGDPRAAKAFENMPVVIVAYSGGFVPAAWSLDVGGLGNRVRGVFLLDALYGELDKFASFITNNRSAFFVSAYTPSTRRHDVELMQMLKDKGIPIITELNKPLKPGTVAFLATEEGIRHRDYVTQAWTEYPVKDVLMKMASPRR